MAAVLKTASRGDLARGFESHALRPHQQELRATCEYGLRRNLRRMRYEECTTTGYRAAEQGFRGSRGPAVTVDACDAATPAPGRMTEAEFRSLYERLRAEVPWGPDDRRGALNYITPADVLAACGAVRLGRTVSLAAPVEDWVTPDNPDPAQHQMKGPLGATPARGCRSAWTGSR